MRSNLKDTSEKRKGNEEKEIKKNEKEEKEKGISERSKMRCDKETNWNVS